MMVTGPCQVIAFDLYRLLSACVLAQPFVNVKTTIYTGQGSGLYRSIDRCSSLQYLTLIDSERSTLGALSPNLPRKQPLEIGAMTD